jgi:hypothetical protein
MLAADACRNVQVSHAAGLFPCLPLRTNDSQSSLCCKDIAKNCGKFACYNSGFKPAFERCIRAVSEEEFSAKWADMERDLNPAMAAYLNTTWVSW